MTNSEPNEQRNPLLMRAIIIAGGAIGLAFLLGVLMGFISGSLENGGMSATGIAIAAGVVLAMGAIIYLGWRFWPRSDPGPVPASERKSRNLYYAAMLLGVVLGIFLVFTGGDPSNVMFSNGPITSIAAIGAILVWAVIAPIGTVYWLRTTDEHDIAAYIDGSNIAFHIYVFLVPSWWMATRAGWVPAQDPMIVWLGVATIWGIGWAYRKYA